MHCYETTLNVQRLFVFVSYLKRYIVEHLHIYFNENPLKAQRIITEGQRVNLMLNKNQFNAQRIITEG